MNYNWHWKVLFETEPGGTGTYLHYLIVGLGWTLATALAAWVIALAIGSVVGTLRTTPIKWVVRLGNLYVEIFRNIPLIVQMFLWFFVVPELLPKALGDWIKQMPPPWGSYIPAVLCLGIFTSVRVAEQVRAGIQSLPRGQRMAGTAHRPHAGADLPLRASCRMAFRIILPPLTSEFMNIIKNSSVALTIGLLELTGRARAMQEFSFQVFEAFAAATVIYLLTNLIVVLAHARAREARCACPGLIAPRGAAAGGALDVRPASTSTSSSARCAYLFREGMIFTLTLTALAMTGGIIFGTLLAMMRLSSVQAAVDARRRLRQPDALGAAGAGDLLVLLPRALHRRLGHRRDAADQGRRVLVGGDHLHDVRGGVLLRDHARRHPVDPARPGLGGLRARPELLADHGHIVLPQAFRNMLPVLLTQTIILFQDTSLVYVISATDFLGAAAKVANRDYRLVEMYTFVAVVYFIISYSLSLRS